MAFIEVKAEFGLILQQLKRIADTLDRAYPEHRDAPMSLKPENIVHATPENVWRAKEKLKRSKTA